MTNFVPVSVSDVHGRLDAIEDGKDFKAGIFQVQDIGDDVLQKVQAAERSKFARGSEFQLAASIPTIFVAKWMREGFNVYREPLNEVIAKCKREGLDAFVVRRT